MSSAAHWRTMPLHHILAHTQRPSQDIPKGNDRAASRMFWTWRASVEGAQKLMCHHLLHAIANLHLRLQHEVASNDEVTSRHQLVPSTPGQNPCWTRELQNRCVSVWTCCESITGYQGLLQTWTQAAELMQHNL